ncbi:MAG: TonB-dependent receptor, partial [Acidobacteriota bacterium]
DDFTADVASVALEHEIVLDGPWNAVVGLGFAAQERPGADRETGVHWLVGATRSLGEGSLIRGSVSRQIRFPTLRDLFDTERGNPDLRTERVLHYEIAGETSLGDRTRLELALFRSDAEDFVQGVPGGRLANIEQVRRQGLELTVRHRQGGLRLVGSYTWLDDEDRSPDAEIETIQNQPEHSASLSVDYAAHDRLDLRADLRLVADRFALSRTRPTRSQELEDYAVLGVRAAWELRDGLRLVGRVENVLDEDYEESIAFPGPGRTVLLGLELGRRR